MGYKRGYQYKTVTPELVEKVKDISKRFPDMTQKQIADYTGWTSNATVSRILRGDYDKLLDMSERKNNDDIIGIIETLYCDVLDTMQANNAILADIAIMLLANSGMSGESAEAARQRIETNRR